MTYDTVSLRDYVGKALNKMYVDRMFVLDGDLSGATRTAHFQKEHPDHFIECGISEGSGVSIATGLAMEGMIPFYVNFALFCTGSAWTQVRMACYARANLKLLATHPGMDNGPDGASHHGNEDIALMRVMPGMRIWVPGSPRELEKAVAMAVDEDGPCYIRCSRDAVPLIDGDADDDFTGLKMVRDRGDDYAIVYESTAGAAAVKGDDILAAEGYRGKLIRVRVIKPFPEMELIGAVSAVRSIVTVENHSVIGGLGSAAAEALSALNAHPPLKRVGVPDVFTQSGPTARVKERYGLSGENVADAARPRG